MTESLSWSPKYVLPWQFCQRPLLPLTPQRLASGAGRQSVVLPVQGARERCRRAAATLLLLLDLGLEALGVLRPVRARSLLRVARALVELRRLALLVLVE